MYVSRKRQAILNALSEQNGERWRVGQRREYPTLFRGTEIITQGEYEVKARIDQLAREHGIDIDYRQYTD